MAKVGESTRDFFTGGAVDYGVHSADKFRRSSGSRKKISAGIFGNGGEWPPVVGTAGKQAFGQAIGSAEGAGAEGGKGAKR